MRLIDADELIKELKSLSIVLSGKQIFSDDAKDTVLRVINEQPTAYDIDKVVEELEEHKDQYRKLQLAHNDKNMIPVYVGKEMAVNCAIEIVKAGWKNENRN